MIVKPRHLAPIVAVGLSLAAGCASTATESAPTGTAAGPADSDIPYEPSMAERLGSPTAAVAGSGGKVGRQAYEEYCAGLSDAAAAIGVTTAKAAFTASADRYSGFVGANCKFTDGDLLAPGVIVTWDGPGEVGLWGSYDAMPDLGTVAGAPAVGQGPDVFVLDRENRFYAHVHGQGDSLTVTPQLESALQTIMQTARTQSKAVTDPELPRTLADQAGVAACGRFSQSDLTNVLGPVQPNEENPIFSWSQAGVSGKADGGSDVSKCSYLYTASDGSMKSLAVQASNEPGINRSVSSAKQTLKIGDTQAYAIPAEAADEYTELFVSEPGQWRYIRSLGTVESLTPLMEKLLDQ